MRKIQSPKKPNGGGGGGQFHRSRQGWRLDMSLERTSKHLFFPPIFFFFLAGIQSVEEEERGGVLPHRPLPLDQTIQSMLGCSAMATIPRTHFRRNRSARRCEETSVAGAAEEYNTGHVPRAVDVSERRGKRA